MKEKVDLTGVSKTLLIPLLSRAIESKKENPDFIDQTAVDIIDSLDYDFKKRFKESKNKLNFWGCAARTVILDEHTNEFIKNNPKCTIINLACGLDNRFTRVDKFLSYISLILTHQKRLIFLLLNIFLSYISLI